MRAERRIRQALPKQRGAGLVEVLVALLVMSVGMLGLAALQLSSLRNNESAMQRAMAVVQTHSIADAMRADRVSAVNDKFDIALTAEKPEGTTFAEIALAEWRDNLRAHLGEGATGSVSCNGSLCTITVQWNDARGTGGSETQTITTQVQL